MSVRELVVLGTASQAPTRHRNHSGFLLRWDGEGVLVDPGEGTQRQMILAGVSPSSITHICITHFHGDHCLGLPGIVQRLSLDTVGHPVHLHYPAYGEQYVDRLLHATVFHDIVDVRLEPFAAAGPIGAVSGATLSAGPLVHSIESWGYRLEEPPHRAMLPDRLAAVGLEGRAIGRLQREGVTEVGGRSVRLEDVSVEQPGQVVAFTLDTRPGAGVVALARDADLLLCEATFLEAEAELADEYGHCTARQAATIAREAGVHRLVLAHYSQRHSDESAFAAEAAEIHPDVVAARDGDRIPVPRRPRPVRR